jgi:hypothetical protein
LQSTLFGANQGTRRFQRGVSASRPIAFQRASGHSCALEATRTQGALLVSSQTSFQNAKKSATHKQIGAAETSSLMDERPKTGNYSSFK